MQLNTTLSPISRDERNKINENWQRIVAECSRLQAQINILSGDVSVEDILQALNDAIAHANDTVAALEQQVQQSIVDNDTATEQAIDNLNSQLQTALNTISTKLTELETAITNAETATTNANTATSEAQKATVNALTVITDMQNFVNELAMVGVYDPTATYDKNNMVRYQKAVYIAVKDGLIGITPTDDGVNWRLVIRDGVDGTGAVSTVNGVSPDENGDVHLTPSDIDAASSTDLSNLQTEVTEHLTEMMSLSPSVLKIPLASDYRGWQGVAVYNDLIYVATDRNENFDLENVISVYSLDGKLISEKRNAYTGLDPQGKFMSFGDINEIDGFLYATVYNFNGGGNPLISRVVKYNIHDLSINQVYEIGENVAESVTKHDNSFWVVYHDIAVVKKFDLNFNFLQEYSLSIQEAIHGYFQGSLWEDNIFYANLHGHNKISDTQPFSKLYKYSFDGTNFNFIEVIEPPTIGCGQGLAKYGDYYFWNDRPNNMIVISKSIKKGNVFPELLPYQNEQSFKPSLLNGWEPYDTNYDRPPRITVRDGVVYLSGMAKNIVNANAYDGNTPMFKIPQQYCPKYSINILALSDKGILRVPIVGKNSISPVEQIGDLNLQNIMQYESIGWVSLDGISYPILD